MNNQKPTLKGRLIQHYRIESLLGEGGMGTVYQATDTLLQRLVAVKMLHPHLVSQTSFMERFRNEALILARLNHPNIAVVYNFLQDNADYFMAMEYVEGDSLEALIRKAGALSPAIAAEVVRHGLEGMAHAMQMELEGTGVRASIVRPGPTWSEMGTDWEDEEAAFVLNQWVRFGLARHPHFMKPTAIADAITTVVSAPRGVHWNLVEVSPEAPLSKQEER